MNTTLAGMPLSSDEQKDRRLRRIGDLIRAACEGEQGAFEELEKAGGEAAIDEYLAAIESPERAERKALAERIVKLRGSARIETALIALSGERRA